MTNVEDALPQVNSRDPSAADQLLPIVYEELRKLAAHRLACENPGQTLQATALVHEAYLRLVGIDSDAAWDNRGHFFAAAAEAMRRILVDSARRKKSHRHGGKHQRHELQEDELVAIPFDDRVLDLNDALEKLSGADAELAELVKLRFFAGLTIDEAATALGTSPRTVKRNWAYARAWLRSEIDDMAERSP